jgi:secreted trypsin-like serine protease
MRAALAAVLTAAGAAGLVLPAPTANAIIGGTVAQQSYPWLVNLNVSDVPVDEAHLCGASMITDRWAVTAAHCVEGDLPIDEIVARVGSNDRTRGGHVRRLTRVILHPDYSKRPDGTHVVADIALIELSAPVDVQPVPIARAAATQGTRTRILGWGNTCADPLPACEVNPVLLNELDTQVTAAGDCDDMNPAMELCTGDPAAKSGPCSGDSGGPQVKAAGDGQWEIVGVTSRGGGGPPCIRGTSIYTSVTAYTRWIEDAVARPVGT